MSRLPCSKGKNIHVIGAISSHGVELMDIRRGAYRWEGANQWLSDLIDVVVQRGVPVDRILVVCGNAPVHCRLEIVAQSKGFNILRLGPYSPMLNPIENVWSTLKATVKIINRIPIVNGPGIIEKRVVYLERAITTALGQITPHICTQAIIHASKFYRRALALEDMPVGS